MGDEHELFPGRRKARGNFLPRVHPDLVLCIPNLTCGALGLLAPGGAGAPGRVGRRQLGARGGGGARRQPSRALRNLAEEVASELRCAARGQERRAGSGGGVAMALGTPPEGGSRRGGRETSAAEGAGQ